MIIFCEKGLNLHAQNEICLRLRMPDCLCLGLVRPKQKCSCDCNCLSNKHYCIWHIKKPARIGLVHVYLDMNELKKFSCLETELFHLVTNSDGLFTCPVDHCEHSSFASQRGSRKHVKKIMVGTIILTSHQKFQRT